MACEEVRTCGSWDARWEQGRSQLCVHSPARFFEPHRRERAFARQEWESRSHEPE